MSATEFFAAAERLRGIVVRVQAEQPVYPALAESPEPDAVRQRFWTPRQLEQAAHGG